MEQQRQDPSVEARDEQHVRRFSRRIGSGGILGAVLGGAAGFLVGMLAFDGTAIVATSLGCALAGALLGGLWGGMSSLDAPDPGREPSETPHPFRDVRSLTHDEGEGETSS
jgi:hypothetical protein